MGPICGALTVSALVLLGAPPANAQQAGKTSGKISGTQLSEWLSHDFSYAGVVHANGCVFLITGPASRRTQFYSCDDGARDVVTGWQRLDGDQLCTTFPGFRMQTNQCREWYEMGANKFELRPAGQDRVSHTVHKLK